MSAFGFVAARLRAPPLVGYLLAGIALGPFTPGLVADASLAAQLADVGVILLMFGVGLHFSPADLLKMRRVALPGAIAQMAIATAIGAGLATAWGWSAGAGVVFGLALSVARHCGAVAGTRTTQRRRLPPPPTRETVRSFDAQEKGAPPRPIFLRS